MKNFYRLVILLLLFLLSAPTKAVDMARLETRTDLAVSTFGVTGNGVIVALLDRGIDWKNEDFKNPDGSTRIKYIFDLTDNSGANAPGNTYGVGTIYTEAQINAALNGGAQLATRDAVGHGTTTAAVAAGNGRNSLNQKYRGFAPNASIIAVKFTTEGAPAHDGEPAEAPFYNPDLLPAAIDFVRDKSAELSMPVVMLANFGSINGPTDGTSAFSREIDDAVGPGKPGIVFVTGTGDDGGRPNHSGGVVAQGGMTQIQIQKSTAGTLRFDLWYGGDDRFDVSLNTPSGNFGPYAAPANNTRDTVQNSTFTYYHNGIGQVFYGAQNQKREIFIDITGPIGTYTVSLTGQTVANGRFDATINPSNIAGGTNQFLNNTVPGSIWDGSTALYNIAPNSYVLRTDWIDIDGVPRTISGEGNIGELWLGSSVGPTFDGRLGVDISAPGDSIFTTYNPTSYFAVFRFNMIQGGNGLYGRFSAVSGAAPQVTGIIALMLEANPGLDAAQIKTILQESARKDMFTGPNANPNWGHGKVDAFGAVSRAVQAAARTKFDFDGDSKTDPSIFRPSAGQWWYLRSSDFGNAAFNFGTPTDELVPADFTGDGKTDIAFWRPSSGEWFVLRSEDNSFYSVPFGTSGDIPVPVDFDGDGKDDTAVFRPTTATWFIDNSSGGTTIQGFGTTEDKPTVNDFDGDGKDDIAIFRPSVSQWWQLRSTAGVVAYQFGSTGDKTVPGDYTGDGKADVAFWRPSSGEWYILRSEDNSFYSVPFGISTDVPTAGDYDGDGKTDTAVFRPSDNNWYVQGSTSGFFQIGFGQSGDIPVPNAYVVP